MFATLCPHPIWVFWCPLFYLGGIPTNAAPHFKLGFLSMECNLNTMANFVPLSFSLTPHFWFPLDSGLSTPVTVLQLLLKRTSSSNPYDISAERKRCWSPLGTCRNTLLQLQTKNTLDSKIPHSLTLTIFSSHSTMHSTWHSTMLRYIFGRMTLANGHTPPPLG